MSPHSPGYLRVLVHLQSHPEHTDELRDEISTWDSVIALQLPLTSEKALAAFPLLSLLHWGPLYTSDSPIILAPSGLHPLDVRCSLPQGDAPPPRKSPAPRAATTAHPIPSEPVRPVFTTVLSSASTTWFPIQHWANKPAVPYTSHAVATTVPPQQAFTRTKVKSIRFTIRHWVPPREYTTAPCAPEPSSLQAHHSHRRYTAHTQLPSVGIRKPKHGFLFRNAVSTSNNIFGLCGHAEDLGFPSIHCPSSSGRCVHPRRPPRKPIIGTTRH
ncbi:hypothetical protein AaE_015731 [Aphanomyces astaci]|uniref:Uncharacterized protein n=1 Tax=Aphanomyces astaci TaxID=112090 RepID=A0A6A4Z643_APHAT|nr:hypothetical protein AaE_015731 [Aphanomyces astaci]